MKKIQFNFSDFENGSLQASRKRLKNFIGVLNIANAKNVFVVNDSKLIGRKIVENIFNKTLNLRG
ncbi:MAG: hypothetical protein IPM51_13290 [Sphingobacteriaceae bacterium]|nr:hypothetical protein [Sphingobacteriaceae bacterium]